MAKTVSIAGAQHHNEYEFHAVCFTTANRAWRPLPQDENKTSDSELQGSFNELMGRARQGDQAAIGQLIQQCRNYLLLIANDQLDQDVQAKIGPSDIVQESMFAAQQYFERFEGTTEQEWLGWLKGILKNGIRGAARDYKGLQKRQVGREQKLYDTGGAPTDISDKFYTPGTQAAANEESELLKQAMQRLPEDYRQVLELRNWQQLSFEEIGIQMQRSADAVRKLWSRALLKLEEEFAASFQSNHQPIDGDKQG